MTIQEAIKSGKPFRRTSETAFTNKWIIRIGGFSGMIHWECGDVATVGLCPDDILATDWEIKQ